MHKEIFGIFVFFFILLCLLSFASYSPADPSIHHAISTDHIRVHNIFGVLGAHFSGFFIGLFGLGAFWIPMLSIWYAINFLGGYELKISLYNAAGWGFLIIATGALFAFPQNHYILFGSKFSAGGIIGIPIKAFLLKYTGFVGGIIILTSILLISLIITTDTSLILIASWLFAITFKFTIMLWKIILKFLESAKTVWFNLIKNRKYQIVNLKLLKPISITKRLPFYKNNGLEEKENHIADQEPVIIIEKAKKNPLDQFDIQNQEPIIIDKNNNDYNPIPNMPKPIEPIESKIDPPKEPELNKKNKDIKISILNKEKLKKSNSIFKKSNNLGFKFPELNFLNDPPASENIINHENLRIMAEVLEAKLSDFGIKGEVMEISPGPVITTFEYKPAPGVKISKIVNLSDDLALALSALSIRIVAPIPGRDVIGVEVPNIERELVCLKEIVASKEFKKLKSKLSICLGKDIVGNAVAVEMDKMPHLLIAGATGTGKSVGLNAIITSLLYKSGPDEVKLIMIDPKRIELSVYNGIPHLITPVVTDMKKATNALFWAVREMERRYELLANHRVRNIVQYNQKVKTSTDDDTELEKLPYLIIIIDELADLMMVSSKDVEHALTRLAQMARAAGIHIILATQRPSVDVLTGIIKANFPTRISFQVSSKIDSRTIIDANGAENLLGNGDMLFVPPGTAKLQRIHGAFISEQEIEKIIEFLKDQGEPNYVEEITAGSSESKSDTSNEDQDKDEKYDDAVEFILKTKQASISAIQRHLRIGYNRAARIIDIMEQEGIVGPSDGVKQREVLISTYEGKM